VTKGEEKGEKEGHGKERVRERWGRME